MRWFVAHTHPNAEAKAASHLQRQGFDVYVPHYRRQRKHAHRIETVATPLFPRYLFVAIDLNAQRWRSICSTVGINRLLSSGDNNNPTPVPDGIVEALKNREDASGFIKLDYRSRFSVGDKVRILDGDFKSFVRLFEGMDERERITILLDLLGRKVRMSLNADLVAAA